MSQLRKLLTYVLDCGSGSVTYLIELAKFPYLVLVSLLLVILNPKVNLQHLFHTAFAAQKQRFGAMTTIVLTGTSSGMGEHFLKRFIAEAEFQKIHIIIITGSPTNQDCAFEDWKCVEHHSTADSNSIHVFKRGEDSLRISQLQCNIRNCDDPYIDIDELDTHLLDHLQPDAEIDYFINFAGVGERAGDEFEQNQIYHGNAIAPMKIVKSLLKINGQKKQPLSVVQISSAQQFISLPQRATYALSKRMLAEFLVQEQAENGNVTLHIIAYGHVDSGWETKLRTSDNLVRSNRKLSLDEAVDTVFEVLKVKKSSIVFRARTEELFATYWAYYCPCIVNNCIYGRALSQMKFKLS